MKADGTKLKQFIVFGEVKRKSEALNKESGLCCAVVSSPNRWMDENLTLKFVECFVAKFSFFGVGFL